MIVLGPAGPRAMQLRIVGVARDAHYDDLRAPPTEIFYAPLAQLPEGLNRLVLSVRTTGDPVALAPAVRRAIDGVAPGIRVRGLSSFEQALNEALARERLAAGLATLFGAVALSLAAVGLYGVVSYNVGRRTREIGVRMALGARPADAQWLVVRYALGMTVAGVLVGVPLALAASSAVRAELYGVEARDPASLAGAALVLVVVGVFAGLVPARRAANVDPVEALRGE